MSVKAMTPEAASVAIVDVMVVLVLVAVVGLL